MSQYTLNIIHQNQTKTIHLTSNQTVKIPAQAGARYQILNEKGVEIANITVPNNQSDMFIYKNELIVWSWQDRTVRYYNIPN